MSLRQPFITTIGGQKQGDQNYAWSIDTAGNATFNGTVTSASTTPASLVNLTVSGHVNIVNASPFVASASPRLAVNPFNVNTGVGVMTGGGPGVDDHAFVVVNTTSPSTAVRTAILGSGDIYTVASMTISGSFAGTVNATTGVAHITDYGNNSLAAMLYIGGDIDDHAIFLTNANTSASYTMQVLNRSSQYAFSIGHDGALGWGAGANHAAEDTNLYRSAANTLKTDDALAFGTAALGVVLKQGANGTVGTFVANGVTPVVVSNSNVAITDAIIISLNAVGGVVGAHPTIATITAATGFTVVCTAADTSTYNYAIIKNAA